MASKTSTTSFDDLPPETASNILLRLPVKALIRSTSVNKKWYSLISNPLFISSQIKHAVSQCDNNVVLIVPPILSQDKHCSLVSVETSKVFEKYKIPFTTKSNTLKLVGSVDGLMLLTDIAMLNSYRDLYLWNPCVRTHRTLVSTCFKNVIGDFVRCFCLVGFGFNKASNDYRVVRIFFARDRVSPSKVEVYSLRKQTWRRIKDPIVPRYGSADGVYVNGSFYWFETTFPTTLGDVRYNNSEDLWILSFDFETEVFGEFKVPRKVALCLGTNAKFRLMEFEGSLAVCMSLSYMVDEAGKWCYLLEVTV
ncbi:F-box/kelch-repeat protein At3g23880-like [Apium graveolens]|uniref:F-box/kelch-repeat protein At3g23880-like n=1 Tax=Apium graveolens TaxID=4045 RepID=UPI003D78F3C7